MTAKPFAFDIRVLACQNCGAPVHTESLDRGDLDCDYCGATHQVSARALPPVETTSQPFAGDEAERLAMLREQDGKQLDAPDSLQNLLHDGRIATWKLEEAVTLWQTARRQLAEQDDYDNAERLFWLTFLLSNHYIIENEPLRARAMYESTLDVLTLPRHRQFMYSCLARHAARGGDLRAAEHWLEPCNPRSIDLESDSDYRVARATIDTVKGDWEAVLETLGPDVDSVPVVSTMDGLAIVMRANALEQLGRIDDGAAQLGVFVLANGEMGSRALEIMIEGFGADGVTVCTESMQLAQAVLAEQRASRAATMAGSGGIGPIFSVLGVLMMIGAVAMGLAAAFADVTANDVGGLAVAGAILGVIGLVFGIVGFRSLAAVRKVRRLHREGVSTPARVVAVAFTGWKINDVPQYEVALEISPEAGTPYQASVRVLSDQYAEGMDVTVKVDPRDPAHIALD